MYQQSAVDIVYQDLNDALAEVRNTNVSPIGVRRAFNRFVELSQKLTSVMRVEFYEITKNNWDASSFDGWNNISSFFKELRNVDQHESPITIQVHERQYYPVGIEGDTKIVIQGTWELADQLSNNPPQGMQLVPADPNTGGPSETELYLMERREYEFYLYPRTEKLEKMLMAIGTRNIHLLSEQYFDILQAYYVHYSHKIRA